MVQTSRTFLGWEPSGFPSRGKFGLPIEPYETQPMSPTPTSHTSETEPGQLLVELEKRQDEVLEELDALDNKLQEVLKGLGVTLDDEISEDAI